MSSRLEALLKFVQQALIEPLGRLAVAIGDALRGSYGIAVRDRKSVV